MDTLVLLAGFRWECTEKRPPLCCQLGKHAAEAELFHRRFVLSPSIRKCLPVAEPKRMPTHSALVMFLEGAEGEFFSGYSLRAASFSVCGLSANKRNSVQTGKTFNS